MAVDQILINAVLVVQWCTSSGPSGAGTGMSIVE